MATQYNETIDVLKGIMVEETNSKRKKTVVGLV